METLNSLLIVFACVLGVNSLISGLMWKTNRTRIFGLIFFVWVAAAVNFVLQGVFQDNDLLMVLAFFSYYPAGLALCAVFEEISQISFRPTLQRSLVLSLITLVGVFILSIFKVDFIFMASLAAIAISYPMIETGIKAFKIQNSDKLLFNLFAALLILNGLHFLDYPLLRQYEETAILGFSLALIITFAFSVLIPVCALRMTDLKHAQFLERTVEERTEELAKSNAQLQETLSQNENLLNIVVHDISSPLMIAKLNIERLLLKTSDETEDLQKLNHSLHKIKLSTHAMQEVLEQVKRLHVADSSPRTFALEPVDIHQAVKDVFRLLEDRMEEKDLRLEFENTLNKSYIVNAEKTVLQNNVIFNLATNAIKFSHKGGVIKVTIDEEADSISIKIKDNGIGIPKEMIKNIFDAKTKVSRHGTNGEPGTGLGLPIVKRCLDQFNATIHCLSEVESHPSTSSSGTQFEIRFPKAS